MIILHADKKCKRLNSNAKKVQRKQASNRGEARSKASKQAKQQQQQVESRIGTHRMEAMGVAAAAAAATFSS